MLWRGLEAAMGKEGMGDDVIIGEDEHGAVGVTAFDQA